MPGSPPSSRTEPRTKPPPVTRSSSPMPEGSRGASCASPPRSCSWKRRPLPGLRPGPAGLSEPSSESVFHSPQASHLPCQRLNAAPQFWQTKVRWRLDMGRILGARRRIRIGREHYKNVASPPGSGLISDLRTASIDNDLYTYNAMYESDEEFANAPCFLLGAQGQSRALHGRGLQHPRAAPCH